MSMLIAFAVPGFIALIVLESILTASRKVRGYETKDTFASLSMGVGNVVVGLFAKAWAFVVYDAASMLAIGQVDFTWWTLPLLLVGEDFCYYWFHRMHHEVRMLWAGHVNHHSSTRYNLSTALRQCWTTPFTGPIFWVPLALIGFDPLAIVFAQSVSLIYQFWIHTELIGGLGPLESFLNTPSHHRVHHGRNVRYLDRNYGGILIVWDRLFDSFEPESEPVDYGLTKNIHTFHPVKIAFHEWAAMFCDARNAETWHDSVSYLLQPPGWSPYRSTQTAREMQADLLKVRGSHQLR
ncbi:MAG: sterol desaturase family protein [Candidatus Binatia bacterium]|nr:sterol desaturase family protein [Candidatus Binatia bacterium]